MKLLLDCHIKSAASAALEHLCPGVDIAHIADWQGGDFRAAADNDILLACSKDGRVFVTYDQRTIPGLLRRWAATEKSHAGVIFGDVDSVPPNNPGAVAAALCSWLNEISTAADMTNIVRFLKARR